MKPLNLLAGSIRLNQPLPWDVLDSRGQLLLSRGYVLTDQEQLLALIRRGAYIDREDFERQQREAPLAPIENFDPFWRWDALFKRLGMSLREHVVDRAFVENITRIADEIDQLTDRDSNAAIFSMVRLDMTAYPIAHSLRTAFISGLLARGLGLTDEQRKVLLKAALTMNIAMLDLQKELHKQAAPLTEAQRAEIKSHPIRGWQHLETLGVTDADWLGAVAQHHETPDGKGYPRGLTEVSPLADIIHHADIYCAMTSGRAYRKPLPSNRVVRDLFVAATAENILPLVLIRKLGIYPPGSFVKLANGETAIVARCGDSAKTPQVYSVQDKHDIGYSVPLRRDTAVPDYAAEGSVDPASIMVQINPLRLFGYDS